MTLPSLHVQTATTCFETNGRREKMSEQKEIILEDIKQLAKDFRKYLQMPKHSNKAGEIHSLIKRLNKSLEKKK